MHWWIPLQPCASQVTSLSLLQVGCPLLITRVTHSVHRTHGNALNLACLRTPGLGAVSDQRIVPPGSFHCHQPSYYEQVCIFKNSANMHLHTSMCPHAYTQFCFLGIKIGSYVRVLNIWFLSFLGGLGEFPCHRMEHHHMVIVTCNALPYLCPDVRALTWLFTVFNFSRDS